MTGKTEIIEKYWVEFLEYLRDMSGSPTIYSTLKASTPIFEFGRIVYSEASSLTEGYKIGALNLETMFWIWYLTEKLANRADSSKEQKG